MMRGVFVVLLSLLGTTACAGREGPAVSGTDRTSAELQPRVTSTASRDFLYPPVATSGVRVVSSFEAPAVVAPAAPASPGVTAPTPPDRGPVAAEPVALHARDVDPDAKEVPGYGMQLGLTKAQVANLLGPPRKASAPGGTLRWEYGDEKDDGRSTRRYGRVTFYTNGTVMMFDEDGLNWPIDLGSSVAYVARPHTPTATEASASGTLSVASAAPKSVDYRPYLPGVAENGSYRGEVSAETGRPKSVYVRGYTRRDGTYVQGHYRSAPRR